MMYRKKQIMKNIIERQNVIVVDVGRDDVYQRRHLYYAISIPLEDIYEKAMHYLPKDKEVYLYDHNGRDGQVAQMLLEDLGYFNIRNIGKLTSWQTLIVRPWK